VNPFDYQKDAHRECRIAVAQIPPGRPRTILLQAPTGSGKTVIASMIMRAAVDKGSPVLFLAHRRELVYQASDKLKAFGVDHGIIMSGEFPDTWAGTQVASDATFRARAFRGRMKWPEAKLVVIDEAHRSLSPTYQKIIDHYVERDAVVLGLTATPMRSDGRGLGHVYQAMIRTPGVPELIQMGRLVAPKHFAPAIPDLTGIKTVRGDYDEKQLQEALDRKQLVGDIVTNWMRLASDRKTIVFATGVRHSISIRDEFIKAGVRAAHIDGETSDTERDQILRDVRSGKIQVISNCMVLTEGYDEPSLTACILARPTKNYGLYVQMGGRVLRTHEGKTDALIIDHAGCFYRHGRLDDPYPWSLDQAGDNEKEVTRQMKVRAKTTITCESCGAIYQGQLICPECRSVPQRKGQHVLSKTGDLVSVDETRRPVNPREWRRYEQVKWFNMFLRYAADKGFKRGWAHHQFKAKFGAYPADDFPVVHKVELTREFVAYIRHLNIRYAKGKQSLDRVKAGNG
jgi:DNA repair protein RadD